ncbi:MAG: dephospho-CoA kinase [Cellulosilyticaceae bacterium]
MMVLGIVGGIGAGKTTIVSLLSILKETYVIGADEIGHKLLLKDGKAYNKVVSAFGEDILDEEGHIIRAKLGAIVFADQTKLQKLNEISHPLIFEEVSFQIEKRKLEDKWEWIIIDAALLIEIGLVKLTDKVIGVYTEEEVRIERIMQREGFTREEALKRINSQKKWEEFNSVSDVVIDNSFSPENTKDQIAKIIVSW